MSMKRSIFILFVLFIFAFSSSALAQFESASSDLNVSMIPENPRPNEEVTISLTSYITDINSASIRWSLNSKVMKNGIGEKTFSFITGSSGTTSTVDIVVQTNEGQTIRKTLRIKPVSVDLVWQSESYVPPFYKGKALFSYQNKITFIAMPHILNSSGQEISPKNLVYTWKMNGSVQDSASGYGKNTFTVLPTILARPMDISVVVTTIDSTSNGFANTNVAPADPSVLLYLKNPVYGIEFQKALSGTADIKDSPEIIVVAVPYFFGSTNGLDLSYNWLINGKNIDDDLTQPARVFRPAEGISGTSNISVSIENVKKVLQTAKSSFNLKFGDPASPPSGF